LSVIKKKLIEFFKFVLAGLTIKKVMFKATFNFY